MIKPISAINTNQYYRKSEKVQNQPLSTNQTLELSGMYAGRAMLARNNISFRNLSKPVEITHLYNKKTKGKDHLDLPNIHVYEYPDTNLRVFVNVDERDHEMPQKIEQLQFLFYARNNIPANQRNQEKDKIILEKLEKELKKISDNIVVGEIMDVRDKFLGFSDIIGEDTLNNAEKYNKTLLNLNFDDKEIQDYYKQVKNNLSLDVCVTVSNDYYAKNKDKIFRNINQGIDIKLKKANETEIIKNAVLQLLEKMSKSIVDAYKGSSKQDILNLDLSEILEETRELYKNSYKETLASEEYLGLMRNLQLAAHQTSIFKVYELLDSITEYDIKNYIEGKLNEDSTASNN